MPLIAPTRTLLLGSGGREHALTWKLAAEPGGNEVVVAPGSDGIGEEPRVRCLPAVDPLDAGGVVKAARKVQAELVVVGPEAPLAAGVADALLEAGIPVFGPTRAAARIETSKAFCHEVAAAAGVRMARAAAFADLGQALAHARRMDAGDVGIVVKADGLAGGKGVTMCESLDDAQAAIRAAFGASPGRPSPAADVAEAAAPVVVIEERLEGREASVIALCNGETALALPAARDHKRLLDGDRGPNTGGMGAYSPIPDLPDPLVDWVVERVHQPILAELARRGTPFRGALYAGLMLTADGPVLLECNARFGDPETQAVLPRLAVALGPLLLAAARGDLRSAVRSLGLEASRLPTTRDATVAIVLAAAGYPAEPRNGEAIGGIEDARAAGCLVFHAGTRRQGDDFVAHGGRVLSVVGRGADLPSARAAAERGADLVTFEGSQRRHDLGATFYVPPREAVAAEVRLTR
ncbi:MAG TPA: phosphoribosylamine--glycine ligase [Candidatus Dormibacteraeota bacterium]|nr:phosphoribosylamine--glycine ligase [Candidatus Dormibacteraeota bacterium]